MKVVEYDLRPVLFIANSNWGGYVRFFGRFGFRWDNYLMFSCRIGIRKYVKLFGYYISPLS